MAIETRYRVPAASDVTSHIDAYTDIAEKVHILKQDNDIVHVHYDQLGDVITALIGLQTHALRGGNDDKTR